MRLALIANAASGGRTDPEPLAARLRAHGATVAVHGFDALDAAAAGGPERLVVAGGDGSIALVAQRAGALGVPLAVIPAGTANDFARVQGLPDDEDAAAALAVTGRALRRLDLGRLAGGRPFVNVASAGLASDAARRARSLKPRLGPLSYAVGAVRAAVTANPVTCVVLADDAPVFAGGAWQVIVGVTGAFGAGSRLGAADPQDGRLDVAVIPAGSRAALARRAWGMRAGTIAEQSGVTHARGAVIGLELPPGTALNVDGEVVRAGEPERATVERHAFRLVVPG